MSVLEFTMPIMMTQGSDGRLISVRKVLAHIAHSPIVTSMLKSQGTIAGPTVRLQPMGSKYCCNNRGDGGIGVR
jgi:hypothetical protein